MSARGLSARGLRAFLLLSALLFSITSAHAETVTLSFETVEGSVGSAGKYRFNRDTTSSLGLAGTKQHTFCISQGTFIGSPGVYTLTDDIASLPTPGGGMGLIKARTIAVLINEVMRPLGSKAAWNDNNTELNGWAAVQGAIWRIINPLASLPGSAAFSTEANSLVSAASSILAGFGNDLAAYYASISGPKFYIHGLDASASQGQLGQDQIYWTETPNFVIEVPVPTGVVMAGMGIVCLGGVNFLRRRKMVAAV